MQVNHEDLKWKMEQARMQADSLGRANEEYRNLNAAYQQLADEHQRCLAQLTAAQTALREAEADAVRRQASGNALYRRIVELCGEFWPKDTRDLEWDVLPGSLAAKLLEQRSRIEKVEADLREAEAARGEAVDLLKLAYGDQQSGNSLGLWMDMRDWLAARAQEAKP